MSRPRLPMEVRSELTAREREVESMKLQGRQNKRIAADLGITLKCVECHVYNIYKKRGVGSIAELFALFKQRRERAEATQAIHGYGALGTGPVWGLQ